MIVSPKVLTRRRCVHKKNELDETLDLKSSEDMSFGYNDIKKTLVGGGTMEWP